MSTTITCTNGSWASTPVTSTRMLVRGQDAMLENVMSHLLHEINRFEMENGNNTLVMASAQNTAKFVRFIKDIEASTVNPFTRYHK